MKLIIGYRKTKRIIDGPFEICCHPDDLRKIKKVIEEALEKDRGYGWVKFDEYIETPDQPYDIIRTHRSIPNTEPIEWD